MVIAEFLSEGWWPLNACGGCAKVLLQKDTSNYVEAYLHAEIDGGPEFIGGPYKFCVNTTEPFKIRGAYRGSNCTQDGFNKERVDLNKHWTTNITGGRSSCID
ncbi:MAG: DUF1036 domain-containing protein [Methylocella sp.]